MAFTKGQYWTEFFVKALPFDYNEPEDRLAVMTEMSPRQPQASQGIVTFGPMLLKASKKLAIYASPVLDDLSRAIQNEVTKLKWTVKKVTNLDEAAKLYSQIYPHLVIVDSRKSKNKEWDPCALTKSMYESLEDPDTVFIGLVDKWPDEKQIKALAESGICQIIRVSSGVSAFRDALQLLEIVWPLQLRVRACSALFSALDVCELPIEITDDSKFVQYVNHSYEQTTGCHRSEVLGFHSSDLRRKSMITPDQRLLPPVKSASSHSAPHHIMSTSHTDQSVSDKSSVLSDTKSAGVFDKTSSADNHKDKWTCVPVKREGLSAGPSEQYVYFRQPHSPLAIRKRGLSKDLGSIRSIKTSTVEAPVTEILCLLREAQNMCHDPELQRPIREAAKILASSEIYAPIITRFRDGDKMASDLFDGLVQPHPVTSNARTRKKSLSDAMRGHKRQSAASTIARTSAEVEAVLVHQGSWHFDVFELERLSNKKPLVHLGMKVFERWKVCEFLRCSELTMRNWLVAIESTYRSDNPYHNATHASDVLQSTAYFLNTEQVQNDVEHVHAIAALLAAVIHDADHPGFGNAFLINTRHKLAILYNDLSVLENHHVALSFQMTLNNDQKINIFSSLRGAEFSSLRQSIVDMVLATDMRRHFEYLAKFQGLLSDYDSEGTISIPVDDKATHSMTICRMMIKCADVSNPSRPWHLCKEWAYRIVEEYVNQTAVEREKGLPLTMQMFDRETCNIPSTQCGFIDMFAREMFSSWCGYTGLDDLLDQIEKNFLKWRELSDHPNSSSVQSPQISSKSSSNSPVRKSV